MKSFKFLVEPVTHMVVIYLNICRNNQLEAYLSI